MRDTTAAACKAACADLAKCRVIEFDERSAVCFLQEQITLANPDGVFFGGGSVSAPGAGLAVHFTVPTQL